MYCNYLLFSLQDCEDHALLICSLPLRFGLNAYICIGYMTGGLAHTWVMIIAPDSFITFWESLTAERSPIILYVMRKHLFDRCSHKSVHPDHPAGVPEPKLEHPYCSIFNHQTFLLSGTYVTAVYEINRQKW